jgi:hypothetical protein
VLALTVTMDFLPSVGALAGGVCAVAAKGRRRAVRADRREPERSGDSRRNESEKDRQTACQTDFKMTQATVMLYFMFGIHFLLPRHSRAQADAKAIA